MIPRLWIRHFDFPEWIQQHPNILETLGIEETIRFYKAELQMFKNYQEEIINQMKNRQSNLAENILDVSNTISDILSPGGSYNQSTAWPYSLTFDGLTQHVETTFSSNGETPTDRTYSFWMKASQAFSTGVENRGVFGYGDNNREAFLINKSQSSIGKPLLQLHGSGMYKYFMTPGHEEDGGGTSGVADGGANETTAHIEAQDDGLWHHWMLFSDVSDAENNKLYIDGVEQDTAKFVNSGTANNHLDSLIIGAVHDGANNDKHFAGSVTNFAVFSDDKTANVSSHYNEGIPKDLTDESDLVGYWKFDEGSGTVVTDSSVNGNDGTINGATWSTDVPK